MADTANTTRRSILKAASVIGASLLTTTADASETPLDRVNRLSEELAEALNNYADGRFHAVVYPSSYAKWPIAFVSNQSTNHKTE